MKIHSDKLSAMHIIHAVQALHSDIRIIGITKHGSRSRKAAFNIQLTGSGKMGGMYGNLDHPTATWDEWGIVIAALFALDPEAHWGKVYESEAHFHWVTGDRFRTLTPEGQHKRHKWDPNGMSCTGSYSTFDCTKCNAHMRSLATWKGFTVADVVG